MRSVPKKCFLATLDAMEAYKKARFQLNFIRALHPFLQTSLKSLPGMLTETSLEVLRFFSRHELEGLQMHSRYLRNLVDGSRETLPLRCISKVTVSVVKGLKELS